MNDLPRAPHACALQVLPSLKSIKQAGETELAQGLARMGGIRMVARKMGIDVKKSR